MRTLVLAACLALPRWAVAQDGWSAAATMPSAHNDALTATVNGRLYVVSGSSGSQTIRFDPQSNTWETREPLPVDRLAGAFGAGVGDRLYLFGGCEGSDCRIGTVNTTHIYDEPSDTWSTGTPMPSVRSHGVTAVLNGEIYVIGGFSACPPCNETAAVEVYDPVNDTWRGTTGMTGTRSQMGAAVYDGKIYVMGGATGGGVVGEIAVYDPAELRWDPIVTMYTPRQAHGVAALGDALYAISGIDMGLQPTRVVERLDMPEAVWTPVGSIPTGRYLAVPQVIDGRIWVAGMGLGNQPSDVLEVYDPPEISAACDGSDADGDGICDDVDACDGDDRFGDGDGDGVCADLDQCLGNDDEGDDDGDGVCGVEGCGCATPTRSPMAALPSLLAALAGVLARRRGRAFARC